MSERRRVWIPVAVAGVVFAAWLAVMSQNGGSGERTEEGSPTGEEDQASPEDAPLAFFDADARSARTRVAELRSLLETLDGRALVTNGGPPDRPVVEPTDERLRAGCNVPLGGLDRDDLGERVEAAVSACGARPLFVPTTIGLGLRVSTQRVRIDDPRLDPLFAAAAAQDVPLFLEGVPAPVYFLPLEGNPLRALFDVRRDLHHHREDWPDHAQAIAELDARIRQLPTDGVVGIRLPEGGDEQPHPLEAHAARVHFVTAGWTALAQRHPQRTLFGSGLALHHDGWAPPDALPSETFDAAAHLEERLAVWRGAPLSEADRRAVLGGTLARLLSEPGE